MYGASVGTAMILANSNVALRSEFDFVFALQ